MSEIKNVGQTWMAKCNQLTPLPFKGLTVCCGNYLSHCCIINTVDRSILSGAAGFVVHEGKTMRNEAKTS